MKVSTGNLNSIKALREAQKVESVKNKTDETRSD